MEILDFNFFTKNKGYNLQSLENLNLDFLPKKSIKWTKLWKNWIFSEKISKI